MCFRLHYIFDGVGHWYFVYNFRTYNLFRSPLEIFNFGPLLVSILISLMLLFIGITITSTG